MPAPIRNTTPRSPEKHKGRTHYGTGSAPKGGHTAPAPVVKTPVRVVTSSGKSYVPKATTKRLKKINAVQRDRAAAAFRVSHLGDPKTDLALWENKIKSAAHAAANGAEIPKDIRQHGADVIPHELWKAYPKATPKLAAAATHLMDDNVPVDVAGSLAIDVLSGGIASAGAKLGARALEAAGAEAAASTATDEAATQAAKAAERALPQTSKAKVAIKDTVERAKTAPARTLKKVKTAPARAAVSASTSEGRKVIVREAGKKALEHRAGTALVAATAAKKSGVNLPVVNEVGNFGQGLTDAVTHKPLKTGLTTLRSLPAAFTGPLALAGSAGSSIIHHDPAPFLKEAKGQYEGVKKILDDATSSNRKVSERAFTDEGAGAFLTPIPAVTRTRAFEVAKEDIKGASGAVRRKVASKSDVLNRNVRHAPEGVKLESKRGSRVKTARLKARADRPALVAASRYSKKIQKAISHRSVPKGAEIALQPVAEYGIRSAEQTKLLRERGPGDQHLLKALDFIDKYPGIFRNKHFMAALEAYKESAQNSPAARALKGERARHLPQGDLLDIAPPELRVPHAARPHTEATDRKGAWQEVEDLKKGEVNARKIAAERRAQAKIAKGEERARLQAGVKDALGDAKDFSKRRKTLAKALDPYTRPEHNIDKAKRTSYDRKLLDEYKAEVNAAAVEHGLHDPIHTAHRPADGHYGEGIQGGIASDRVASRKEHMRQSALGEHGTLAGADNLDRSLAGLLEHSVKRPRVVAGGKQFMRDFVKHYQTKFTIDGEVRNVGQGHGEWTQITQRKTKDNPNGGQVDPKGWVRLPMREAKNAIEDPYATDHDLNAILQKALDNQIKPSEPWVLVPREAVKEQQAQISGELNPLGRGLNHLAKFSNRAILATNPAWVAAQTIAEAIPIAVAYPEVIVKGAKAYHEFNRWAKKNPEEAYALQGTIGASPSSSAALHTPGDMREAYTTPDMFDKGAKALTRGRSARAFFSAIKLEPLGLLDASRQNKYRTMSALMQADRDFRTFSHGLADLFDRQAKLSHRFRGKPRAELFDYLTKTAEGRKDLTKLADAVDDVNGNWTAFTHVEQAYGPALIFYPFLRYSMRWTLWTFPKSHPLAATLLYTTGQANANQIDKLLGHPAGDPLAYTNPLYEAENGKAVLPAGSRVSPGQSVFTNVAFSGNPSELVGAVNPVIEAVNTGLGGPDPFGQQPSGPRGWAALDQLVTLPAPVRIGLGPGGTQGLAAKLGVAAKPGDSKVSQAFRNLDPQKSTRSLFDPLLPLSADRFKASQKLSHLLDLISNKPSISDYISARESGDTAKVKELDKAKAQASWASDELGKMIPTGASEKKVLDQAYSDYYGSGTDSSSTPGPLFATGKRKVKPIPTNNSSGGGSLFAPGAK